MDGPDTTLNAAPVSLRRLGQTDLMITPIGLGVWQLSEGKGGARAVWSAVSDPEADALVRAALEGGIDWFDTAEAYGFGRSERDLARGLTAAGRRPGEVVVATKWFPIGRTARSLRRTIHRRLEALRPFSIDLYQVHNPLSFSTVEAEMEAMADLVEAGHIRAVGVSNFSADQMRRAHEVLARRGLVLASNQVKYSPWDRRIEHNGVLQTARELGVTIIAYSPLEMGLLTGRFHADPGTLARVPVARRQLLRKHLAATAPLVEALTGIAEAHRATPAQVVLSWLISACGETVVVIPGASRAGQARESARAMRLRLSVEEMDRIEGLGRQTRPGPRSLS